MYSCTICFDNLVGNGAAAALQCGHTFHKKCISHWLNLPASKTECPLCKKKVHKGRMIDHLYFSSNDDSARNNQAVTFPSASSSRDTTALSTANSIADSLRREIQLLKQQHQVEQEKNMSLQREYNAVKKQNEKQEKELREHQKTRRYLKQIKRVTDLDDDLSSPASILYMQSLENQLRPELITICGALRSRQAKASKERDLLRQKLDVSERNYQIQAGKCERLRTEVKKLRAAASSATTSTSSSSTTTTNNFSSTFQPKNVNIIVLDESDDDEEEQVLAGHSMLDQDDEDNYVVEEHNPTVVNRHSKRRADLSDDEDMNNSSSRQSKTIKISDTDEDDYIIATAAGPSSSSDYST